MRPYAAHRLGRIFRKKDQEMMPELFKRRDEEDSYISHYQQQHANLEVLMSRALHFDTEELDKAWTARNPEL